ncbi:MAG: oligosaccharide flippase family protein [Streptosporangiales bacterium]|nr:oligosaccharide flippase family protein [Streptosporangiales bacterium]
MSEDTARVDHQVMGMARGASLNITGAACTQLALLTLTVFLSRTLGSAGLGRYAQAYALLVLLVLVAALPFGSGTVRFIAMHRAEGDEAAVRGALRLGVGLTAVTALCLAAPLAALAPRLADGVFHDPLLTTPLRLVALALPAAALAESALLATMGFSRMRARALIKLIAEPVLRVGGFVILVLLGLGLSGAMFAIVGSTAIEAALAGRALRRYVRRYLGPAGVVPRYEPRQLLVFSLLSGGAALATTGLVWADTLILGAFRPSGEVGVYVAATKIVALATFVLPAINQAFAPRITNLYHRGETDRLQHAYRVVAGWNLRLTLPAFAVLVVFPADLLDLVGPGLASGAIATVILVTGQLVNTATGPSAMVLTMSGRAGWSMANNGAALVLNVGLNLWLVPAHGIVGAAAAWALALIVVNLARVAQVWLFLHMSPFHLGQLRALLAGGLALLAGWSVEALTAGAIPGAARLVLGGFAVCAGYVAAISVLQFDAEDRQVVRMLARRLGVHRHPTRAGEAGGEGHGSAT